jgi:hypothetical protein
MPSPQELENLEYGAPPTIDCEAVIKEYFERVLFDPYSAHYKFGSPQKFWYKEPPLLGGRLYAGYVVFVGVNAKNRMGGYVGMKEYGFLFNSNQLIRVLEPEKIRLMR